MNGKNKRIAFVINKLGVGGAETVFVRDANALFDRGYNIYFVILFGSNNEQPLLDRLKLPKDRILFCGAESLFDLRGFMRFRNIIKTNNVNVLYSTLNEANIWCRKIKLFIPRLKTIIREANVASIKPLKFKILDIILYPLTNKIAAVSDGVKESLGYLPGSKIMVLENGVAIPDEPISSNKDLHKLKLIFVGSLTPKKDVPFLIEGVKQYKDMGNDFTLEIIGDGAERQKVEDLIAKLGLEAEVKLLGKLPAQEVSTHYAKNDIFVLPSRFEGSPNVLLEAMAHRLPVITSDFLGARAVIKNKQNGLIVTQGDAKALAEAIEFYVKNPDEMRHIAQNGFDLVKQNYSIERHISKLLEILEA